MVDEASRRPPAGRASFREKNGWGVSEVLFFCVLALALTAVVLCGRFAYREGTLLEIAKSNAQAVAKWAETAAAANEKGVAFAPQACSVRLMPPAPPPESAAGVLPEATVARDDLQAPAQGQAERSASAASAVVVEVRAAPAAQGASSPLVRVGFGMLPAKAGEGPGEHVEESPAPAPRAQAVAAAADTPAPTWKSCLEALLAPGGPLASLSNPFNAANGVIGPKCERKSALTRGLVLVDKGTPPPPGSPTPVLWAPIDDGEAVAKGLMLRIRVCDPGGYPLAVAEVTL